MSFLAPKLPGPPAPPPPPPMPPQMASSSVQSGAAAARAAAAAASGQGFGGTVQTGSQGAGTPSTAMKTLLGNPGTLGNQ